MTKLYDGRGQLEPEATGDPTAAFAALRRTIETQGARTIAEMAVMRRGLEAAFDQLEKIEPQADYKPQLARIVKQIDQVSERLHGVEQSPVLQQGAQHYAAVMERSGRGLVMDAVQRLELKAASFERAGHNLSACLASARKRNQQEWWILAAFGFGILPGIMLTLFVPRVLPFSAASHVASIVMGAPAWQAGMSLMAFGSPEGWRRVVTADQLLVANQEAVTACQKAAAKAAKEQRCTIIVPAPGK